MATRCPICGAENPEAATFCVSCGNRIPNIPLVQPPHQLAAVGIGIIIGSIVGYLVGGMLYYWPGPPLLPYIALVYGLGAAVVLISHLGQHLFPAKTRMYLSPFSIAFACAYYFVCFGYFYVHV